MGENIEWLDGKTDDLEKAFAIRIEVFCDEQGYAPSMELDNQDAFSWHLLYCMNGIPAATGRVYWKDGRTIGLGRIAVRQPWRGKGLGRKVLSAMEEKARALGAQSAELDAQCRAIGFYEKCGYIVCGEEHMDGHVPHKLMRKNL